MYSVPVPGVLNKLLHYPVLQYCAMVQWQFQYLVPVVQVLECWVHMHTTGVLPYFLLFFHTVAQVQCSISYCMILRSTTTWYVQCLLNIVLQILEYSSTWYQYSSMAYAYAFLLSYSEYEYCSTRYSCSSTEDSPSVHFLKRRWRTPPPPAGSLRSLHILVFLTHIYSP